MDASDRVLIDDTPPWSARVACVQDLPGFEAGGPRREIFFDPSKTRVGIVTCGGLCPGLNNVIRGLGRERSHRRPSGPRAPARWSVARWAAKD